MVQSFHRDVHVGTKDYMTQVQTDNKCPQPDPAEENAFFPSSYSLRQFTSPKSDLSGADYPTPYQGEKKS